MGWLRIVSGPNTGTKFYLGDRSVTIGRDPANPIQIIDEQVSRHHAYIRFEDGKYRVADMKSANGLYVNGKRIDTAVLRTGDRLLVGRVEFEFLVRTDSDVSIPTQARPPRTDESAARRTATAQTDRPAVQHVPKETLVLQLLDGLHGLGREGAPASQLFDHLLPGVLTLLEVDRVVVLLHSQQGGKLRSAAFLERDPVPKGVQRPSFVHEVVRRSVNARTTISIEIPAERLNHPRDARAACASPLIPRRAVIGALYVDRLGARASTFSPDERRLLNTFATQLSIHLRA